MCHNRIFLEIYNSEIETTWEEATEGVFTNEELDALILLFNQSNKHEFTYKIFQKIRSKGVHKSVPDEFYYTNIASRIGDTLDNPLFSMFPTEQLIHIIYLSIDTVLTEEENKEKSE